jgi:hypothetical protein
MKTFKEFIEEAYLTEAKTYTKTRSREEAEKIRQSQEDPSAHRLKNRQSAEMPLWGIESREKRKGQAQRRDERIKSVTGTQTPEEQRRTAAKRRLAQERGKQVHHNVETETSAKEFAGLSPKQIEAKKKEDAKQGRFHGDDRRNLVLANPGKSTDSPGFSHTGYHAFERRNRKKLEDIKTAISPQRAFTTLTNKERKQNKS